MSGARKGIGWLGLLVGVFLLFFPAVGGRYLVSFLIFLFMYIGLASAWNLFSGFCGYLSLGHGLFFGVGAYTCAVAVVRLGLPFAVGIPLGGIVAMAVAVLFGFILLRVRFRIAYFAMVTLGLNEIIRTLITNSTYLGETYGFTLPPMSTPNIAYYILLGVAVLSVGASWAFRRSRRGLALSAILGDEDVAAMMGVNTFREKMAAFVLSGLFPGLIGGTVAWYWSYIDPFMAFDLLFSFDMAIMTLFGGIGTIWGPVIGASVISLLVEMLWTNLRNLHAIIFGALVVVLVILSPGGMLELARRWPFRGRRPVEEADIVEAQG